MGIADFLAQAGAGTAIGNIAGAFGGRTAGQSALDNFTQNEVPALYDQAKAATTPEQLHQFMMDFTAKAGRAGYSPDAALKFAKEFVAPLSQGMQANALDQISQRFAPQTAPLTPTVAPQGQGQPLPEGTSFTPQTTPGRDPNTQDVLDLAAINTRYGQPVQPLGYQQLLETPSKIQIQNAQAGKEKTQQSMEQLKLDEINKLPTTSLGGTGVTAKALGAIGGLGQFVGAQTKPPDPLEEAKRGLIQAQIAHAQAATGEAQRGNIPQPSPEYRDYLATGGQPGDQQGFLDYVRKKNAAAASLQEKPVPTPQIQTALDTVISKLASLRRNPVTATVLGGQTPEFIDLAAQKDALTAELQKRREGGGTSPTPTPGPAPAQAAGRKGPPKPPPGATPRPRAVNPQTGEAVEFDGKNWVPVK